MSQPTAKGVLSGRAAMVTGGARGIGFVTARTLAEAGADLLLLDVMDEVADSAAKIEALGVRALGVKADVTNGDEVAAAVQQAVDRFGRLDVLVNNAGVTRDGLILRMTDEQWDLVLRVNLKGAFVCTRAVTRQMMRQKGGSIVNVASIVGVIGNAGQANYSASKGGLIAFTKSVARELAPRGVRCNAVAPGFIRTDMTDELPDDVKARAVQDIPLGRMGEAEDVARAILFLASDASSYVTGHVLHVTGGMGM